MDIKEVRTIVYPAFSKFNFYSRMFISKYILERDCVPLNPFNVWEYFVYELVPREYIYRGNYNLARISDELWAFGPIADGVWAEIEWAMTFNKPVKFFTLGSRYEDIKPLGINGLVFEEELLAKRSKDELLEKINKYIHTI